MDVAAGNGTGTGADAQVQGQPSREPEAALLGVNSPSAHSPPPPPSGGVTLLLQFVVFPLAIVLIAVAITGLFTWVTADRRSYDEYLNEIANGWAAKRGQAAYELSFRIADPQDPLKKTADVTKTLAVFETAKGERDPKVRGYVRRYLAVVLGHIGKADAIGPLVEATTDDDLETRLNATWALGRIRAATAVPAIVKLLEDPFEGERKVACFALGEIGDRAAREPLVSVLQGDRVIDVRWNAALALARLKDARALPMLVSMLDRKSLDAIGSRPQDAPEGAARLPMSDEQREAVMVNAIRGILELEATDALAAIDQVAEHDRSYTVRQAAMEARDKLRAKAPAPASPGQR